MDGVTAVDGFSFQAGATQGNTNILNGNPNAAPITLEDVDFEDLKTKANLYLGQEGLDAEILMLRDGRIRVKPYTPPRWDLVDFDRRESVIVGYEDQTRIETRAVQVGTTTEERTRSVVTGYETETYDVTLPIYEYEEVERTRDVPIWDERTVTRTRWIEVFVPYETDAEGGTTVAGEGTLGEYVWVEEEYETTEWYVSGYTEETYTETIQVQVGETTETRSRDVPIYGEETYTVEVPVYEDQEVEITESVPIYDDVVITQQRWQYSPPIALGYAMVWVKDASGVIFIDGRILSLHGELDGRVTIVSTGNWQGCRA